MTKHQNNTQQIKEKTMASSKTQDKKPNTKNNKTKNNIGKCSTSKTRQKPRQDENETLQQIAKHKHDKKQKEESKSKGKAEERESKKREKGVDAGDDGEEETCKFAFTRVKRIIKSELSDMKISNDAVYLINKATEKFLETFSQDAYASSVEDRKKSISYKHLSKVVHNEKRYEFLSDFVPEMVKAEDALAERMKTMDAFGS